MLAIWLLYESNCYYLLQNIEPHKQGSIDDDGKGNVNSSKYKIFLEVKTAKKF